MVKGKVAPPKCLLLSPRLKDTYTLIEQSLLNSCQKLAFINNIWLYNWFTISLAIAICDVYMQLRNIVYDVTVK